VAGGPPFCFALLLHVVVDHLRLCIMPLTLVFVIANHITIVITGSTSRIALKQYVCVVIISSWACCIK
jgi:hypothetical protein